MSFKQFQRFTSDAGGLEKILRLCQSLAQIFAAYAFTVDSVVFWMHLRRQFALGRRYFRFFKFITCFQKAFDSIRYPTNAESVLETGKWTFMGCYLGLETITILDAMGVYPTPMADLCMLYANQCWFYSLFFSITKHLLDLQLYYNVKTHIISVDGRVKSRRGSDSSGSIKIKGVKRRLISDSFDLFIPGHVTGWITTGMGIVGIASVVSTCLSAVDIWDACDNKEKEASTKLASGTINLPDILVTSGGEKVQVRTRSASRTPSRSPRRISRRNIT